MRCGVRKRSASISGNRMQAGGFIARRLRMGDKMAVTAIAISFFVIILAVAISAGFRREIRGGVSAVTGDDYTLDDIMHDMERISHMLRGMTAISFAINEGVKNLRDTHDAIPAWNFDKDPDIPVFTEGTDKMDREDMEKAKTMFYEAMGWNTETGIPTRETLEKYGLEDLAAKMDEYGLL